MPTKNENGRKYVVLIGLYMLLKVVLNLFCGGGFSFVDLIFAIVASAVMFCGLEYSNYAVAGILAIVAIVHLPGNFGDLPKSIVFLLEGFVDIGAAVLLVMNNDIKEHFTNKWNELYDMMKK